MFPFTYPSFGTTLSNEAALALVLPFTLHFPSSNFVPNTGQTSGILMSNGVMLKGSPFTLARCFAEDHIAYCGVLFPPTLKPCVLWCNPFRQPQLLVFAPYFLTKLLLRTVSTLPQSHLTSHSHTFWLPHFTRPLLFTTKS